MMRSSFGTFRAVSLLFCFALIASAQQRPADAGRPSAAEALARYEQLLQATSDPEKTFYLTTKAAAAALAAGESGKAKAYSKALLEQAALMRDDWNYGNAIHVANLVLGQVALSSGDLTEAKRLLLEAGGTPGSPQLNNFGPNMQLAKGLLAKGEREAVLQYFVLCANFWKDREGKLGEWKAAIRKGGEPEFGANLNYQLEDWRFENWERLRS
jgi:hypothetical protein